MNSFTDTGEYLLVIIVLIIGVPISFVCGFITKLLE